jgi:ABC-type oligopeptide transport system ATPase subunit
MPLLEIRKLKKYFPVGAGFFSRGGGEVKAVDGVDLAESLPSAGPFSG